MGQHPVNDGDCRVLWRQERAWSAWQKCCTRPAPRRQRSAQCCCSSSAGGASRASSNEPYHGSRESEALTHEASTSGMKAHLMNTKIEEIISSVVEAERLRALQETDAVTRSTLSEDTLPSQVTQVDCDLSEADLKAVDYLSGALKKEGLAASSAALAASESAFAAAVHTESLDAVDWAMQRQQAAKERNLLHQKRLHLGVKRAFNKTESQRSHAEKLHQDQILPAAGHQEATPSLEDYERSWNARERKADAAALQQEQQELKNAVIGKIAVDTGLASGPIVVMVYANDSAESIADDFCATYNKYSAEARNTVLAAVEDSIALNAEYTEDSDWVVLSEMQIVHVDMRRSY